MFLNLNFFFLVSGFLAFGFFSEAVEFVKYTKIENTKLIEASTSILILLEPFEVSEISYCLARCNNYPECQVATFNSSKHCSLFSDQVTTLDLEVDDEAFIMTNKQIQECLNLDYYADTDQKVCKAKFTESITCSRDGECLDSKGLFCMDGVCRCKNPEYKFWSISSNMCEEMKKGNESCLSDIECLKAANLTCRSGLCQCNIPKDWSFTENKCMEKQTYESICYDTDQCSQFRGLECSSYICKCIKPDENDWSSSTEKCVSKSICSFVSGCTCVDGICKFTGVHLNIAVSSFMNAGYNLILNQPYSYAVFSSFLTSSVRPQCHSESILCVGGADPTESLLELVACGNCFVVTSETVLNNPVFENGAYWYFTPSNSYGFTEVLPISQNSADTGSLVPEKRLSWHLGSGGYRLGTKLHATNERKMIFVKH